MDVGEVRKRVVRAIGDARDRGKRRRELIAGVEQAYELFLRDVAAPMAHQVAAALKAEKLAFTVFTPNGTVRLAADRGRDDFVEFALDTSGDEPQVLGQIRYTRGSRTLERTLPIKPGVAPDRLTDEDVLTFLLDALKPWIE